MTDELIMALDECLTAIASGTTVEAAVARYPALADELRPMLEAAQAAGASSAPVAIPHAVQMSSRAGFLARAAELRAGASPAFRRGFLPQLLTTRAWATGLAVVLALVIGTYGVVSASAPSLPGDALYGVKRTVEQVEMSLAPDPQTRAQLEEQFAVRRVDETRALTAQKREAQVEFRGLVESITGEQWSVAGMTVIVANGTRVNGSPAPGVWVEVSGATQLDGTVRALAVTVITGGETPTPTEPTASATVLPTATRTPAPTEPASPTLSADTTESATTTPATPASSTTPEPTAGVGVEFEFTGIVESIGVNVWRISAQTVTVTASTELRGNPQVGQTVEVKAIRDASGVLVARRIEVKTSGTSGPSASNTPSGGGGGGSGPSPSNTPEPTRTPEPTHTSEPTATQHAEEIDFEGTLQSISGNIWTVGGQAVTVTGSTEIKDNPQVGDTVRVRALQQPDGSLIAERIEKR
jgi:type VI secretion system secreted protein VgrG